MNALENWQTVGSTSMVAPGECAGVVVCDKRLAIYFVNGEWFCTDNICTHQFAVLTDGWLEDHVIECPLHAGRFDIRTGMGLSPPIVQDIKTYQVRVQGESVQVNVD
jgi:nitrite reductase/ring-hydroxylating ferredoxin subunit